LRSKYTRDDYRYFPAPYQPPLHGDRDWLEALRAALPELPADRRARYQRVLGLSAYDAAVLVADPDATGLLEATMAADPGLAPKAVANWVTGEYLRLRNAAAPDAPIEVAPAELAAIIAAVEGGAISRANGKEVLEAHVASGDASAAIIDARGLHQISDPDAVGQAVDAALAANPDAVADYRAGKQQVVGFLVGQVMKATRGQADAAMVQAAVRARLDEAEQADSGPAE
jgi:aspartyl-tRNA(Asn)/glutamyl-tRNA(Gln) amidotransferase subunit B